MSAHHDMSSEVIERDANGVATSWLSTCGCKKRWTGATYERVEDKWRQHVYEVTGRAPGPMGNPSGRWMP